MNETAQIKIGVRRQTRERFEIVASARGWTLAETASRVIEYYIRRNRIRRAVAPRNINIAPGKNS